MTQLHTKQRKASTPNGEISSVFGENLRRLRGERSQSDFANFLRQHQQTYVRYEQGRVPKADVLHQMATSLGVSMEDLLTGQRVDPPRSRRIIFGATPGSEQAARIQETPPEETISARLVRVVACVQAGAATDRGELVPEEQWTVATDCRDPKAFAVELRGDSMLPVYRPGDVAVVAPSADLRRECLVVARVRDEGVLFKVFTYGSATKAACRLSSYNPAFLPMEFRLEEDLEWIYPVHSVIKPAT